MTIPSRVVVILGLLLVFVGCKSPSTNAVYSKISGKTMGTFYNISCQGCPQDWQEDVDRIFAKFNDELSTYIPDSYISRWNTSKDGKLDTNTPEVFIQCFKKSKEIYQLSGGLFDPTILPLLNYYGFGPEKRNSSDIDKAELSSLLDKIGLDHVSLEEGYVIKDKPSIQLDFNAIAKGQGVDLIAEYLDGQNIENYLVEVGGEVVAKGVNKKGKLWTLGINTPNKKAALNDLIEVVTLENKGMATSGNYRNHIEMDGKMLTHIVNPNTGASEMTEVLSATVIAQDCMTADALATTCMLLSPEKTFDLINSLEMTEALIITGAEDGQFNISKTEGFGKQ